jgi:HEAT repeat protein
VSTDVARIAPDMCARRLFVSLHARLFLGLHARLFVGLCMILFAGIAVGQDDVPRLVAELGETTDYTKRSAAYSALQRKKPLSALPLLAKSLPGYNLSSQSLGLSLLQGYPKDKSRPFLRKLLSCKSAFLELGAAAALYQAGDKSMVDHIVHGLQNSASDSETSMMMGRIYNVREPRVAATVRKLLAPGASITTLDAVLRYLKYSKDPEGTETIKKLLASDWLDSDSRAVCASYLLAMGDASHAKDLVAALESGEVRSFTRLNNYLRDAPHLDEKILAAILKFVEDNMHDTTQVTYALQILAKHRYRRAMRVIRDLLESEEPRLSKAAFDALLEMGDELKPQYLRRLLDPDRPQLCIVAADALRRLDDMSGLQPLLAVVKKGGATKSDAVAALGKFRVRAAVRPLIDALNDPNSTVRSRAYQGLGTVLRALFPYKRLDLATTGYTTGGSAAKRKESAARILAWWERNRKE